MQIKQYLKDVASVVLSPVVKSLSNAFPAYGAGISMMSEGRFIMFGLTDMAAYNNKIFYTAQNIIVRKFIEAPIIFSKKKEGQGKRLSKYYSKSITNERRALIKAQALTEVEDHELNVLFDKGNSYQSGIEVMEDFWHNYGFGDGFLFFEDKSGGLSRMSKPKAIHSLLRDRVEIVPSNDRFDPVLEYKYTCWNGQIIAIPKTHILHLKHWNPNIAQLKGLGVDRVAQIDISLNNSNNLAQGAAFENGGRGTLFSSEVEVTSDGKKIGKASVEEMKLLKETIDRDMAGARNNRRMKFTTAHVNVTPYGDTLAEMELNKAEENNWRNIFAIHGIPWALSPVSSDAAENSIKIGFKTLVTNLIISEERKFDQKLTQTVQQWWPDIIAAHDITEYSELAPDLELMSKVFNRQDGPLLSEDERRSIYSYDEIGGEVGGMYLVPTGLIQAKDLASTEFDDMPDNEGVL